MFTVNPLSGALQVLDTEVAQAAAPAVTAAPRPAGLFDDVKDKHLVRLGVPEALLPLVRRLEDEDDLDHAVSALPQEAHEALLLLAAGYTLSEVFREMEKPEEPLLRLRKQSQRHSKTRIRSGVSTSSRKRKSWRRSSTHRSNSGVFFCTRSKESS